MLGAGVAGLVAAYELRKRGYEVDVYEAGDRVGGRILTHRFGSGPAASLAELGAMRIPTDHLLTLGYLDELGLADRIRPFRSLLAEGNAYLATASGPVRVAQASPRLVRALRDRLPDRAHRPESLLLAAWFATVVEAIAPPRLRGLITPGSGAMRALLDLLDRLDLAPYLDPGGGPADLARFFADHPGHRLALPRELDGFVSDILTETSPRLVRLDGGMDALPARLAAALGDAVRLRHRLTGLRVRERDVILELSVPGRTLLRRADYAVCAVPFSALRRVRLDGLPREKLDVIRETEYCRATKVAFHCREPFWRRDGITGGASFTGGDIRQTYYPEHGSALLASYTIGDDADRLGRMSPRERHEHVRRQLARVHPELDEPGMVLGAVSRAWGGDDAAGAGCTIRWGMTARAAERQRELAARPERHLFFAGEHCSALPAWIEGAIASAVDAVDGLDAHRTASYPVGRPA